MLCFDSMASSATARVRSIVKRAVFLRLLLLGDSRRRPVLSKDLSARFSG